MSDTKMILRNYVLDGPSPDKLTQVGRPARAIVKEILGHPTQRVVLVGGSLYAIPRERSAQGIPTDTDKTDLGTPRALEAWARGHWDRVIWTKKELPWKTNRDLGAAVTWATVQATLEKVAPRYEAVESLPHHEAIDSILYLRDPESWTAPEGQGTPLLDAFCSRLKGETPYDDALLRALLLTQFWGGRKGGRPLFIITSRYGRGAGKTSVAQAVAFVTGGANLVENVKNEREVSTALGSRRERMILLDNLKDTLDSGTIESWVTAPEITSRALYSNPTTQPGTLTWVITTNSADVSTDFAQRAVIIKLGKPDLAFDFMAWAREFVDEHREGLIAECLNVLRSANMGTISDESCDRWQAWQRGVMCKVTSDPDALAGVLAERRGAVDGEADLAATLAHRLRVRLTLAGHDPDTARVIIPTDTLREVWKDLSGERSMSHRKMWSGVKPLLLSAPLAGCDQGRTRETRGLIWRGMDAGEDDPIVEWDETVSGGGQGTVTFPTRHTSPSEKQSVDSSEMLISNLIRDLA